jgi:ribosome biogenesis GTPase
LIEGIVIKSTGSWYTVKDIDGNYVDCKIKGKFRIKGIRTTNPVAIGDKVFFKKQENDKAGLITKINERKNYIIRKATNLSKQSHIIASNIDQAVLIVTLAEPRTSTGFIDRFLVTAEAYHIPAHIIFNKIDLYDEALLASLKQNRKIYEKIGYPCHDISVLEETNLDEIYTLVKDKVNLFSGHSGVGKSALINKIQPGLNLKTGQISTAHKKGTHTTTFTEMIEIDKGGFIIDTPGIKEFGLIHFEKEEVAERFPEMRKYMHDCKFNNCTHVHEPCCAVIEAFKKNKISKSRYYNYLNILNDDYFNNTEY